MRHHTSKHPAGTAAEHHHVPAFNVSPHNMGVAVDTHVVSKIPAVSAARHYM